MFILLQRRLLKIVLGNIRSHLIDDEIHFDFTYESVVRAAHHRRRSQVLRSGMAFMIQQVHRTRSFHSQVAEVISKLQTDQAPLS